MGEKQQQVIGLESPVNHSRMKVNWKHELEAQLHQWAGKVEIR